MTPYDADMPSDEESLFMDAVELIKFLGSFVVFLAGLAMPCLLCCYSFIRPDLRQCFRWSTWKIVVNGQELLMWNRSIAIQFNSRQRGWIYFLMFNDSRLRIMSNENQGYPVITAREEEDFIDNIESAKMCARGNEAQPFDECQIGPWAIRLTRRGFICATNKEADVSVCMEEADDAGIAFEAGLTTRWMTVGDNKLKRYNCGCTSCYGTDNNFHLTRHCDRKHLRLRRWKCPFCNQRRAQRCDLRRHLTAKKHNIDPNMAEQILDAIAEKIQQEAHQQEQPTESSSEEEEAVPMPPRRRRRARQTLHIRFNPIVRARPIEARNSEEMAQLRNSQEMLMLLKVPRDEEH